MDWLSELVVGTLLLPLSIVLVRERRASIYTAALFALLLGPYLGNWLETPTGLENVRNVILAMVGLGTLFVGYSGLQTWRRQLRGTNEYALAEKLGMAALAALYSVEHFRSAGITALPHERMEELKESTMGKFIDLLEKVSMADLLWGDAHVVEVAFREMESVAIQVMSGYDLWRIGTQDLKTYTLELIEEAHRLAFNKDGSDEMGRKLKASTEIIREFCREKMRG